MIVTVASADVMLPVTCQTAKRKSPEEYAVQEFQVRCAEVNAEDEACVVLSSNIRALEPGTWTEVRNKDDSDDETTCDLDDVYNRFAGMYESEEEAPPEPPGSEDPWYGDHNHIRALVSRWHIGDPVPDPR